MTRYFKVFLLIFVSVGCGELVLRFLGFGQMLKYQYDLMLGWVMTPNQEAYAPSYGVGYFINDQGLRDEDLTVSKQLGEYRILGLGDSITFGQGVDQHETFIQNIEKYLNASVEYDTVQVINSGVAGYNLFQELAFLETHGLAYQPDIVILGFCKNDVVSKDQAHHLIKLAEQGLVFGMGATWSKWKKRIAWLHLLHGVYLRLAPYQDAEQNVFAFVPNRQPADLSWHHTEEQLVKLAQILRARNIPLVVVVFPWKQEIIEQEPDSCLRWMNPIAMREQFVVIDLFEAFRKHPADDLFLDPVHLSAMGHRVVSDVVCQTLIQK